MRGAPSLHPRHVDRSSEVVAVRCFGEPAALTRGLARLAARELRAVPLMPQVARIGSKQFPTAQALASSRALHRSASPSGGSCDQLPHANGATLAPARTRKTRRRRLLR